MPASHNFSEITPWLHEESFWQQNQEAFGELFHTMAADQPASGVDILLDQVNEEAPSDEALNWMWTRFMGRQHGTMEGEDSKIKLPRSDEYLYWPDYARVRYGDHSLVIPSRVDNEQEYTKAFLLGGTALENVDRLLAVLDSDPNNGSVQEFVMMSGQRLRGWDAPGEASAKELLDVTSQRAGVSRETLERRSPFIKAQMQKTGLAWDAPFADEYAMSRLAVEAVFMKQIDWKEYPVSITEDTHADPVRFSDGYVPARTEAMATYHLKDGRKVHVINGKAIERPNGAMPRPTSDSQTREAVDLLIPHDAREKLVIVSTVPHTRAAVDGLVRILAMRRSAVQRADIVTSSWQPWKELLAGFGEIPATHKADRRLRAALAGQDPDSDQFN